MRGMIKVCDLPKDDDNRITGAIGRQLVHGAFSMEHWEYREVTGVDRGKDCELELIEDGKYINKKIHIQVKGTKHIKNYETTDDEHFSFPLERKTIYYALSCTEPFILCLADAVSMTVYYLPIQDYFISKPEEFDRLEKNKSKMTLYIPKDNIVSDDDFDLQQIAKSIYVGGPSRNLCKA